jgi:uncharacterized protein YdhG (YjbR/CyaY superfamily)
METLGDYLATLPEAEHRARFGEIFDWIHQQFPQLESKIGWNQPMFTDHGTFIIGFSAAKKNLAFMPERAGMAHLSEAITKSGYTHTDNIIRIPWDAPVDYDLLREAIEFNIADKADCQTFWRK